MITHMVFWKLKENAQGKTRAQNVEIIKHMLRGLLGEIPGLISLEVGENLNNGEYDAGLVTVFENEEALKNYITHPEHKKVSEFVKSVRYDRVCVDIKNQSKLNF